MHAVRRPWRIPIAIALLLLPLVGLLPGTAEASGPDFSDGFESGTFSAWSSTVGGVVVQGTSVHSGAEAAEIAAAGGPAAIGRTLDAAQSQLYVDLSFRVASRSTAANLVRVLSTSGSIATTGLTKDGSLSAGNDVAGTLDRSRSTIADQQWHELQMHVLIGGADGRIDMWLDGLRLGRLSHPQDLGTAGITEMRIGDEKAGRTFDVDVDDVTTAASLVGAQDGVPPSPAPGNVVATGTSSDEVSLSWTAAADDVGVGGYTIYRDGTPVGLSGDTSYVDADVDATTTYAYAVDAFDYAGNHSSPSDPPTSVTTPVADPEIAAAGDVACDPADPSFNHLAGTATHCVMMATAQALAADDPDAVLALGDLQYDCGGYQAYLQSYDPTWGTEKAITDPGPGNQEYRNAGGTDCSALHDGADYFRYWGGRFGQADPLGNLKGYYSFDLGAWHIISLNSECAYVSCAAGSPQETWLKHDLETHPATCTLAFWHRPHFGPTRDYDNSATAPFWNDLYKAGADVILNGHAHVYQRFGPADPSRHADASSGIREFIVGTGGERLSPIATSTAPLSQVFDSHTFGVLRMTLHSSSYDWRFVPVAGGTFTDEGRGDCH
jgi:Calcineurin-like phosphoesterase